MEIHIKRIERNELTRFGFFFIYFFIMEYGVIEMYRAVDILKYIFYYFFGGKQGVCLSVCPNKIDKQ